MSASDVESFLAQGESVLLVFAPADGHFGWIVRVLGQQTTAVPGIRGRTGNKYEKDRVMISF